MKFFETLTSLLPRGKAFSVVQDTTLRKLISGLSVLPDDIRTDLEKIYMDLYPDTTRALREWESQFGVLFAAEQYGGSRVGILKALWQANGGGQTAQYLQGLLRQINTQISVVENNPVKNPRDANSVFACMCGQQSSVAGNRKLSCGYKAGDSAFIPSVIRNDSEGVYDIPVESTFWENYFFICKNVVKNSLGEIIYCQKLIMDSKWKPYVEYLILKIKPVQTGAIIFIEWVDGWDDTPPLPEE